MSLNSATVNRTETSSKELTLANPNPRHEAPPRACLLQQLQELSVTMLRATTTAMAVRSPRTALSLEELAGGCLAFCGPDVPLTRAIGVGTAGSVREDGSCQGGILLQGPKLGGANCHLGAH